MQGPQGLLAAYCRLPACTACTGRYLRYDADYLGVLHCSSGYTIDVLANKAIIAARIIFPLAFMADGR